MGILRNEPVYRIASGGTAGLTEILLFHPLDVIKTRLQSQTPGSPDAYKEMIDHMIIFGAAWWPRVTLKMGLRVVNT